MTLFLIEGKMNSGKTLLATFYALKDYQEGRKIISNYDLNIPHYEINKDFLEWLSIKQPSTEGISFFFDELWIWGLDSRTSTANSILTYFFLQSSKGDTRVYMTTQSAGQLDIRVRDNAHVIVKCERRVLLGNKMRRISDRIRKLGSKINSILYIKVAEYEYKSSLYNYLYPTKIYYIKADWIFKFFFTNQKISPTNKK